jgi:hypothetical protein
MKRFTATLLRPFVLLLAAATPPCRRIVQEASARLDSGRRRSTPWRTRAHLLICAACARYLRQLELIHSAAAQLPEHPAVGSKLPEDSRNRIKTRLKCERSGTR